MRKPIVTFVLLLALVIPLLPLAANDTTANSLVFTHVTVIDATGAPAQPDMTVVITGNRITTISKAGKVRLPIGESTIVDATGKFLIPGLWDMHLHSLYPGRPEFFFPLLIANGVTGVREMASAFSFAEINAIRNDVKSGKTLAPRFGAVPGKILEGSDGADSLRPEFVVVSSVEQARETVRSYKQQGADFIKVYNLLPRDVYLAIVDEAKRQKIPFAGHPPFVLSAAEVSDLGQRSIEHVIDLPVSCSRNEAALRKELQELLKAANSSQARVAIELKALDSYDEQKAAALFARFVRNKTWQCPTLAVGRVAALSEDELTNDPRLKYIPVAVRDRWRALYKQRYGVGGNVELAQLKRRFQRRLEIVGAMQRAGVSILAGTDTGFGNPYTFPGLSLHEELSLLVQSGLTPMQALQAATRNAARFLNLQNTLGTIEKGKIADLVLLDANPLDDITNTQRISAVVVNGRYLSAAELKKMLANVEAAARQ